MTHSAELVRPGMFHFTLTQAAEHPLPISAALISAGGSPETNKPH